MSRLFLIPLILCIAWLLISQQLKMPFTKAKKGYYWIIGLSAVLIGFISLMLWLTQYQLQG